MLLRSNTYNMISI